MAIATLIGPGTLATVQDDLWHIALSDNSGQTDFKYVFDIYNATTSQQLIRVKLYPEPTNGRGYFNAAGIVRNEIKFDWFVPVQSTASYKPFLNNIALDGRAGVSYNIFVGEDYSGITTLNMASGNTVAYNFAPPLYKRRQIDYSSIDGWYSNRPLITKCQLQQKLLIPYKAEGVNVATGMAIRVKANNQASAYTGNLTNFLTTQFIQLDIGPETLNLYLQANGVAYPYIDSGTSFYDVEVYSLDTTSYSTKLRVNIECQPRYSPINLYFINQWGMFDTACFNLASRLSMTTERKTFSKKDNTFNNSSVTYFDSKNVYNESKVNYGSKSDYNHKLTMDFPTDEEYEWLAELISSPQIYADIEGNYYPITIQDTNYEYSKYENNHLKQLEITIELNQTRFGFRR